MYIDRSIDIYMCVCVDRCILTGPRSGTQVHAGLHIWQLTLDDLRLDSAKPKSTCIYIYIYIYIRITGPCSDAQVHAGLHVCVCVYIYKQIYIYR